MVREDDDGLGDQEERMINEEYKIWKKNTPFLYASATYVFNVLALLLDPLYMSSKVMHSERMPDVASRCDCNGADAAFPCLWSFIHALTPLRIQKMPQSLTTRVAQTRSEHSGVAKQKLILGTHTSDGEQNHLMLAEVQLPLEDTEYDARVYDEEKMEVGGVGMADGIGHVTVVQQINHDGEVNRARYMPQNEFMIATKTPTADVLVFDWSTHDSKPSRDSKCTPFLKLVGHDSEGYGLSWNPHEAKKGYLLSGSDDANICMWDINGAKAGTVRAYRTLKGHSGVVEDVAWHGKDPNVFGSCGDDKKLMLWDLRRDTGLPFDETEAHTAEVNCVAFNPFEDFLLATGSADRTVVLHDMRMLGQRLHVMDAHREEVFQIGWAPNNPTVLASCGADRRLNVWGLHKIGDQQSPEDAEDGPPELLFVHGGHTSKISDFAWNVEVDWMVASVAEDNILQIWEMADEIHARDDNGALDNGKP